MLRTAGARLGASLVPSALGAAAPRTLQQLPRTFAVDVVVPPLGDSISEGTIAAVLKGAGEAVLENETIAQIETDKVTIDIKSPADGTLVGLLVKADDTVVPGQLVARLDAVVPAG